MYGAGGVSCRKRGKELYKGGGEAVVPSLIGHPASVDVKQHKSQKSCRKRGKEL